MNIQGLLFSCSILVILPNFITSRIENPAFSLIKKLHQQPAKRKLNRECNQFINIPNAITFDADVFRREQYAITKDDCMRSCAEEDSFYCVAALFNKPGYCFLHGYRQRYDFWTTQYRRVCGGGPMCFDLRRGWTGHFKNRIAIPERSAMTSDSKKRFCSQRCETNRFCMGFELRDNTPECFFANLHILHDANFNLFLRRC